MSNGPIELSMEQQFNLAAFETQVKGWNEEETKKALVQLFRHMMLQQNTYKQLLAEKWGIEPPNLSRRDHEV